MEYNNNDNKNYNDNDNTNNFDNNIDYDIIHHNQDNEDRSAIILDGNDVDDVKVIYIILIYHECVIN
jgi:hypothetical protein